MSLRHRLVESALLMTLFGLIGCTKPDSDDPTYLVNDVSLEHPSVLENPMPHDDMQLLDPLIEEYKLTSRRTAIYDTVARRAVLLRTSPGKDEDIPVGATKIGGNPDLPPSVQWPRYSDGSPLAFLVQIDLSAIARLGTPIIGLPDDGILAIFSVWGWTSQDDLDPHTPEDRTYDRQEDAGWSVAIHYPNVGLRRATPPGKVSSYPAAPVEPIAILSLPNHRIEPALASLKWSKDEYERFDSMQMKYRSCQMERLLNKSDTFASHHLLGGYAVFQQAYPKELLTKKLAMLFQLGSDSNTGMCWGDGGELTFYADAAALRSGQFKRLWATCQGG